MRQRNSSLERYACDIIMCVLIVLSTLLHFLKLQGKMWTIMCSPVTLAFHEEEIKMKGCEIV